MTVIITPFNLSPAADVRRLVADLEAIPNHRDRRGRVYSLSSLLVIHLPATVGDGQGQ